MRIFIRILFVIFIVWFAIGVYVINTEHEKAQIIMGLGVLYFSFILMPIFIYDRYKDGKYKKYIINDDKLRKAFKQQGKG